MALNVATLPLILCRKVKTIKHGSVRINIVHFPISCFHNFCSAVPTTFYSFLMIFLHYNETLASILDIHFVMVCYVLRNIIL